MVPLLQVPERASVKVPAYSFPEKFSSFSFLTLLTKGEVIAALVKVRAECNKVRCSGLTTNFLASVKNDYSTALQII